MNFFDSIKKIFNMNNEENLEDSSDLEKNEELELQNLEKIKENQNKEEDIDLEQKDIQIMAEKAFKAKMAGNFEEALSLWDDFSNEYPEAEPQARARKAKIYIILGDDNAAKKELLNFFEWYSKKGSFDYSSRYFTVFISALQDLGYQIGDWSDSDAYINNISGEDISLDKKLTMKRIKKGLEFLKEKNIWSSSLEQVEKNLDMLT